MSRSRRARYSPSLVVFWPRLRTLLTARRACNRDYLRSSCCAFLITAVGGLSVKKSGCDLPETVAPIAGALIVGGVMILLIEATYRRPANAALTWRVAFWVGVLQILAAVFPGTSRSAATIFAAMLAGQTARPAATEFSFLVGIPTMFAATGFEFLKAHQAGAAASPEDWPAFIVAFIVSAVVAFIAVKWLLHYVQTHRFTAFAWYRIVAGIALLALVR